MKDHNRLRDRNRHISTYYRCKKIIRLDHTERKWMQHGRCRMKHAYSYESRRHIKRRVCLNFSLSLWVLSCERSLDLQFTDRKCRHLGWHSGHMLSELISGCDYVVEETKDIKRNWSVRCSHCWTLGWRAKFKSFLYLLARSSRCPMGHCVRYQVTFSLLLFRTVLLICKHGWFSDYKSNCTFTLLVDHLFSRKFSEMSLSIKFIITLNMTSFFPQTSFPLFSLLDSCVGEPNNRHFPLKDVYLAGFVSGDSRNYGPCCWYLSVKLFFSYNKLSHSFGWSPLCKEIWLGFHVIEHWYECHVLLLPHESKALFTLNVKTLFTLNVKTLFTLNVKALFSLNVKALFTLSIKALFTLNVKALFTNLPVWWTDWNGTRGFTSWFH